MRPGKDEYFLKKAWATSERSTCVRRAVGCVLVNGLGHDVGSGYNGRPTGFDHCTHEHSNAYPTLNDRRRAFEQFQWDSKGPIELPQVQEGRYDLRIYPYACKDAFTPSGAKPAGCEAVHAEVNAWNQCYDRMWVDTVYITRAPCVPCTKMLLNTSARRIVFAETCSVHDISKELWLRNNGRKLNPLIPQVRVWDYVPYPKP